MITVRYEISPPAADRATWIVRATASDAGDPRLAKPFVFQQAAGDYDETTGAVGDRFSCVASLAQLETTPEDAPAGGAPWYRLAAVEVACKSAAEAADFKRIVGEDIQQLVDDFNAGEALEDDETIIYT